MDLNIDKVNQANLEEKALLSLRLLTGDDTATFRSGQLEAIEELVINGGRALLVQRTGYGKSAVYFIATKLLREMKNNCSILISPLLALMKNQMNAAERMGLSVATINSENNDDWEEIFHNLDHDSVDLLLVSPERLANPEFLKRMSGVLKESGLLIIDEAHCISDWGHDFRPDYQRIGQLLQKLSTGVPVLACTATATSHVVNDVIEQLSTERDLRIFRGPLRREGLGLLAMEKPAREERVAWLIHFLQEIEGSGIIYCLTIADTKKLSRTLQAFGIKAEAYHSQVDSGQKQAILSALVDNRLKAVVATSALGMGYDKLDLKFVVHYQSPSSPLSYYQEVGRAGRGLDQSFGVLLVGSEDKEIQDFFIDSAFPDPEMVDMILAMEKGNDWWTVTDLITQFGYSKKKIVQFMKILSVEGAVTNEGAPDNRVHCWKRTPKAWSYDYDRRSKVKERRLIDQKKMSEYLNTLGCRMRFLIAALDGVDEANDAKCGACDNCTDEPLFNYQISRSFLLEVSEKMQDSSQ